VLLLAVRCKKEDNIVVIPVNSIKDIDGNIYKTVNIGLQVWMAENLKVTHFRNGEPIPYANEWGHWMTHNNAACCDYNSHPGNIKFFGKLYNGYAVTDKRNIAPEGWHVASDTEWDALASYLGGYTIAGGKLKDTTISWIKPNAGATNESGFSAQPGGYRFFYSQYSDANKGAFWWTSTEYDSAYIGFRVLRNSHTYLFGSKTYKGYGYSVRCVKD